MDVVTKIGLVELALGAVLGWAVAGQIALPGLAERLGVRAPKRILQAHLDYVIMGLILTAVGVAMPRLPVWLVVVLVAGTWVNPALFFPLAFDPRSAARRWFQVISALSFVATSGGLVAVAVAGIAR